MTKNKLLLLLALLMTAATGAWATDVITVTWSSGDTYENNNSKDGVTLSGDIVEYNGEEWQLAYYKSKGTFTTELGNFTKIEITGGYVNGFSGEGWSGRTWTGNAAAVPFGGYITDDSGDQPWTITFTIEPASSAPTTYKVTMKDGVKDADKWTVKVGEGQAQALPIGGLKGDGSETVTLQYNGRLKVKGVKATSDAAPAVKPAATVTTAPTAKTGVKAGEDVAIVNAGAATGGTMMYKVTTENTKPTSTEGFSATVPTAETLAAGTFYVWYYVKADDTHTDSEISATAIAVTIAAAAPATITVTWNNDDITGSGKSFTKDGVTITAGDIDFGEKNFMMGGTFTTTLGNFTKIEVTTGFWDASGTGWSGSGQSATWTGTPASSVSFSGDIMGMGGMMGTTKFVFTIEPTN